MLSSFVPTPVVIDRTERQAASNERGGRIWQVLFEKKGNHLCVRKSRSPPPAADRSRYHDNGSTLGIGLTKKSFRIKKASIRNLGLSDVDDYAQQDDTAELTGSMTGFSQRSTLQRCDVEELRAIYDDPLPPSRTAPDTNLHSVTPSQQTSCLSSNLPHPQQKEEKATAASRLSEPRPLPNLSSPTQQVPAPAQQQNPQQHQPELPYELIKNEREELGYMRFHHEYVNHRKDIPTSTLWEHAAREQKPVFWVHALVPGDTDAGRDLFSHPLLIEAAETLFVTACTVKEHTEDDHVLDDDDQYGESDMQRKSCTGRICSTRIHLLHPDTGCELVPMIAGDRLTRWCLLEAMVQAIEMVGTSSVPQYLRLLLQEEIGRTTSWCHNLSNTNTCVAYNHQVRTRHQRAVLAAVDLAVAEAELGGIEGVLGTRTGFLERQKVVEVSYDSETISYGALIRNVLTLIKSCHIVYYQTNEERMAAMIEIHRSRRQRYVNLQEFHFQPEDTILPTSRPSSDDMTTLDNITSTSATLTIRNDYDPKHALRGTPMRFVPLTDFQALRVNRLIHLGKFNEAVRLLSPRQGFILMKAMRVAAQKTLYEVINVPILIAWLSVCHKEHPKRIGQLWSSFSSSSATEPLDDSDQSSCSSDTVLPIIC